MIFVLTARLRQCAIPQRERQAHTQVCVLAWQVGVVAVQLALVRHCTQPPVVASHTGVAAKVAQLALVVHWAHVPALAPVVRQIGAVVGQFALLVHCTQV